MPCVTWQQKSVRAQLDGDGLGPQSSQNGEGQAELGSGPEAHEVGASEAEDMSTASSIVEDCYPAESVDDAAASLAESASMAVDDESWRLRKKPVRFRLFQGEPPMMLCKILWCSRK